MVQISRLSALVAVLAGLVLAPEHLLGQPRTEIRDAVRGVSFHSIELSDEALNSLDVVEGTFADSDRLALGLSALLFDGSRNVDEYVLWIRHEGRRWLDFTLATPVAIEIDGQPLHVDRLRASQPFVGASARLFEKIEFRLAESDLERIMGGTAVTLRLHAGDGTVAKRLTTDELARLRSFHAALATRG